MKAKQIMLQRVLRYRMNKITKKYKGMIIDENLFYKIRDEIAQMANNIHKNNKRITFEIKYD